MSKIVRHEFMGSWVYFWLLCVTVPLIPIAILRLRNGALRTETETNDPEAIVDKLRRA